MIYICNHCMKWFKKLPDVNICPLCPQEGRFPEALSTPPEIVPIDIIYSWAKNWIEIDWEVNMEYIKSPNKKGYKSAVRKLQAYKKLNFRL